MNKIVIQINRDTIKEDQLILFSMGYGWFGKYYSGGKIKEEYTFRENDILLLTPNKLIFKVKKNYLKQFENEIEYYNSVKTFSRIYKLKKLFKKDT